MLKITDMPIQTLVRKLRRAGKQSRAGNLEFLQLSIRYNREIKTFMHFVPLNYLESLFISVYRNEVLASTKYESTDIVYHVKNRTTLKFEISKFALFQSEFFDSKLNNYRIQSRQEILNFSFEEQAVDKI